MSPAATAEPTTKGSVATTNTMPQVECYFEQVTLDVGQYANLRQSLLLRGISPYDFPHNIFNCRGFGLCGTCGVEVLDGMENLTPRTWLEKIHLGDCPPTFRLACQCQVVKNKVTVITHPKIR